MQWTIFILIITIGNNSINLVHGVTVLALCISSDHGFHLYQVSCNYLDWFQKYRVDTILILINTKGHNSIKTLHGVTVLVEYSLQIV